jgi:hypothetical protein
VTVLATLDGEPADDALWLPLLPSEAVSLLGVADAWASVEACAADDDGILRVCPA